MGKTECQSKGEKKKVKKNEKKGKCIFFSYIFILLIYFCLSIDQGGANIITSEMFSCT